MQDWIGAAAAGVLALVALALGAALLRARSRTDRELEAARAERAELRAQIEALEARVSRPEPRTAPEAEFVITGLGQPEAEPAPKIETTLFADIVLRETVVKAASLAHGLRRALDPETRHRIRYEMGREVKRARKQRRVDTRQARREWQARQRADEGNAA
ncbi:hypothetical protein [Nocardioides caricicola]|uniref:Uncharacterized protein n=1 Tax=Nocardioides caricicola TaxID=634770 RepID=A0ABW0N4U0_9ACTN